MTKTDAPAGVLEDVCDRLFTERDDPVRRYFDQEMNRWSERERRQVAQDVAALANVRSGGLSQVMADLDAFNHLTEATENDEWYGQEAAFTSMHLDALLPGFARARLVEIAESSSELLQAKGSEVSYGEIGCGSGFLASQLADRNPDWTFTMIDKSEQALSFVRAFFAATRPKTIVKPLHAELHDLPRAVGSFDCLVAAEVLEHDTDPVTSVQTLLRHLKDDGVFVVSLPIDLDISMHPTVFKSADDIRDFFKQFSLRTIRDVLVAPDARDPIAKVFPGFAGCLTLYMSK